MRKTFLVLLLTFSIGLSSQNSDTYIAWRLSDAVYQYFDSLGVKEMKSQTEPCDCGMTITSKIAFISKKGEAIDSVLLDEVDDEDMDLIIDRYLKKIKKLGQPSFTEVLIEVNIKRVSNRFNIFHLSRKVKYNLDLQLSWKPKSK